MCHPQLPLDILGILEPDLTIGALHLVHHIPAQGAAILQRKQIEQFQRSLLCLPDRIVRSDGFGTFHFVVTHITIIVITEASGVVCISALHLCIDNDLKSFIGRGGVASLEGVSR